MITHGAALGAEGLTTRQSVSAGALDGVGDGDELC
jgi:hypothetical protein